MTHQCDNKKAERDEDYLRQAQNTRLYELRQTDVWNTAMKSIKDGISSGVLEVKHFKVVWPCKLLSRARITAVIFKGANAGLSFSSPSELIRDIEYGTSAFRRLAEERSSLPIPEGKDVKDLILEVAKKKKILWMACVTTENMKEIQIR